MVFDVCLNLGSILVLLLELSFNANEFGRVLLVKPSMFGKLEVHVLEVVWRFESITFYIGELRVKLILAPHANLSSKVDFSLNPNNVIINPG